MLNRDKDSGKAKDSDVLSLSVCGQGWWWHLKGEILVPCVECSLVLSCGVSPSGLAYIHSVLLKMRYKFGNKHIFGLNLSWLSPGSWTSTHVKWTPYTVPKDSFPHSLSRIEKPIVLHGFPSHFEIHQPENGPTLPFLLICHRFFSLAVLHHDRTDSKVTPSFSVPFTVYMLSLHLEFFPSFSLSHLVFFNSFLCTAARTMVVLLRKFKRSPVATKTVVPPLLSTGIRGCALGASLCLGTICHFPSPHWVISPQP